MWSGSGPDRVAPFLSTSANRKRLSRVNHKKQEKLSDSLSRERASRTPPKSKRRWKIGRAHRCRMCCSGWVGEGGLVRKRVNKVRNYRSLCHSTAFSLRKVAWRGAWLTKEKWLLIGGKFMWSSHAIAAGRGNESARLAVVPAKMWYIFQICKLEIFI